MNNIYETQLKQLIEFAPAQQPCVSFFVPLIWNEFSPRKTFNALMKVANMILIRNNFDPLKSDQIDWGKWIKEGTTTLAIYKSEDFMKVASLPIRMPPKVFVASSFHVKPLLAASLSHSDALLVYFNDMGAGLYRVNSGNDELIDTFLPPKTLLKGEWGSKMTRSETKDFLKFLRLEVKRHQTPSTQFLGLSGIGNDLLFEKEFWGETGLIVLPVSELHNVRYPMNSITSLRLKISSQSIFRFRKQVERHLAETDTNRNDISTLGELIINKKLSKLCVSLEDLYYGRLDQKTGIAKVEQLSDLAIGDDLIDDLVELALKNGIQVSVVPKMFLPSGKSYLAS